MRTLWTLLFTRHCPLCRVVVQRADAGVVRHLGRLYCCQAHADTAEQQLDASRRAFQREHASRHGRNRLLPEDDSSQSPPR
jgi:hypothetical protein